MTAPGLTYPQLRDLQPCEGRRKAVARKLGGARKWNTVTAAQAREAGVAFDDILWVIVKLARKDKDIERRLQLWLADCSARVLHVFEGRHPTDQRPRAAIVAARRFARGEITARDVATRDAAWDAAWPAGAARDARDAAWSAGAAVAGANAARTGAIAARTAAARADAGTASAEGAWQFDRLCSRFSEIEPEDWPLPAVPSAQAPGAVL